MKTVEDSTFSMRNLGRNINILYKTADVLIGLDLILQGNNKEEALRRLKVGKGGLKTILESLERLEKPSDEKRFELEESLLKAYSTKNSGNLKRAIDDSLSVIEKIIKNQAPENEEIKYAKTVVLGINKRFAMRTQSDHQKLAEILAPFSMRRESIL